MSRKNRTFRKNGIYHIIQRGNNKTFIFDDRLDKQTFHEIIQGVLNAHQFNLLYYVFMDNHYHFLIEILDDNISDIMKLINLRYSKYYNKKYNRGGTIFGGRYSAFEVFSTPYLIKLIGYIAHNPVKAKMVKNAKDYRWSAHHDVVSEIEGIANTNRLMELIDESPKRALEIYQEIIKKEIIDYQYDQVVDQAENSKFIEDIKRKKIKKEAMIAMNYSSKNFELLCSNFRSDERSKLRKICVAHLKIKGYTNKEVADFMAVSKRTIRNLNA